MKYLRHCFLAAARRFFALLRLWMAKHVKCRNSSDRIAGKSLRSSHSSEVRGRVRPKIRTTRTLSRSCLTIEQTMKGKEQEITAKASAHRGGPTGTLVGMEGLRVHVTQPADFGTTAKEKSGEVRITNTVPAPNGKYKAVVAEATHQLARVHQHRHHADGSGRQVGSVRPAQDVAPAGKGCSST